MVVLYHYTTKSSLNGIKADKVIYQSTRKQRDAVLGPGVYLTSLNPNDHSKKSIAANNWREGKDSRMTDGYLDYYIEIQIDDDHRRLRKCHDRDDRDLYRFDGDIYLGEFEKVLTSCYVNNLSAAIISISIF